MPACPCSPHLISRESVVGGPDGEGLLKSPPQPWEGGVKSLIFVVFTWPALMQYGPKLPRRALVFTLFLSTETSPLPPPHMSFFKVAGDTQ